MSVEEQKALVRRFLDRLCNHGRDAAAAIIDELLTPGFVHHFDTDRRFTREQYRAGSRQIHQALPDVRATIEDLIAEGDRVVARVTVAGTHRGAFMGRPPTGNRVRYTSTTTYRLADGRIQEDWENWDGLGFARQTGMLPEPTAPSNSAATP